MCLFSDGAGPSVSLCHKFFVRVHAFFYLLRAADGDLAQIAREHRLELAQPLRLVRVRVRVRVRVGVQSWG